MNEFQVISLVTLIAAMVLVGSEFRGNKVGARKALGMVAIWVAVFAGVALVFSSMG